MKLYFMKQTALDYLKANMSTLYINYYRENTNKWITDLFDYDPFEVFIEVPDFQLAPIPVENNKRGEMDLQNCKILYTKLINSLLELELCSTGSCSVIITIPDIPKITCSCIIGIFCPVVSC